MNNIVQFEDLKKKREKANKIKSLKRSIKDYEQIVTAKKLYLKQLSKFENYGKIKDECRKVYIQIIDYESNIRFVERQIDNLSQG